MRYYKTMILNVFFIFSLLWGNFSFAGEVQSPAPFGLAMHGAPKYTGEDSHLSYVNPDAPKGGALKMAAIGSFDTLNPYSIKGSAAEGLAMTYDRLMQRVWDEPFSLYPLIAQSADISEDRSEVTFHLDPRAVFHDKTPVTAQDVKFSFEQLRDKGRPNMRRVYKLADKVEIRSDHEIYFHFGEGYDRETVMIFAMMPIISQKWWTNREFDSTLADSPLSNGPYRIKESNTGKRIVYERVKDYWAKDLLVNKGLYNFDTITYDYYRDDTVALQAFKKGDLDLRREWDVTKWASAYKDIDSQKIDLKTIAHQRPERAHGFIFNLRRAPFNNLDVRKALSLAFDYGWTGKNLFYSQFKPINGVFPNSQLSAPLIPNEKEIAALEPFKDSLPASAFAPLPPIDEKDMRSRLLMADKLLTRAGYIIENGVRINQKDKKRLTFEMILLSVQEEKIALNYKRNLKKIGIDMSIRQLDSASFQDRKNAYAYDMISFYWQSSLSPGSEQMAYWSCAAAKNEAGFNFSGICSPSLDHFAQEIANSETYDDLLFNAHLIDRILRTNVIFVPLFYKNADFIAAQNTIKSPDTTPIYGAVTESWWKESK